MMRTKTLEYIAVIATILLVANIKNMVKLVFWLENRLF